MKRSRVPLGNYVTEYSVRNKSDEDIPVYSVTNSQGFCTEYFDKEVASKDKTTYKIVPRGYFAYNPSRINVGSVDWQKCEERVIVSPLYNVFSVSKNMDQQYLYYFLRSDIGKQMIKAKASGSVRDNLKMDMLKEMTIPERTIEEQKKCVAILDELKTVILLREKELEKLDELIKARFVEMFGDEKSFIQKANHKVKDVCDSRVGIVIQPTQYYVEDSVNGVKAFRSLNVKPFRVNNKDWVFFSEEDNAKLERTQVHTDDVAVVRSGVNLGDSCIITNEYDGCNAIDILLLSCYKVVRPSYLSSFINYPVGKGQIINVQRGGAIKHINLKQLESSDIYIPPLEEQKEYELFVAQVDKSKFKDTNIMLEGGFYNGYEFFIS